MIVDASPKGRFIVYGMWNLESSVTNVARRNLCAFEDYKTTTIFGQIISLISQLSCVANKVIMVVMGLNVVEGVLYWRIWTHINR